MQPLVIGIGGSPRAGSTGELALHMALQAAEEAGARTQAFNGAFLASLPIYAPENPERTGEQLQLVEAVRCADGLILASPGYHGGISGSMKNALDLLEDLHSDRRCYLDGRAVGCIITAGGWQTVGIALTALRSIVHALRGWPTPLGVPIVADKGMFDSSGTCLIPKVHEQIDIMARQVVAFASFRAASATVTA